MTNAEAWFSNSLHPRKPEGSLGRTAQDGHLDSHTAPELCTRLFILVIFFFLNGTLIQKEIFFSIWVKTTFLL